MKYECKCIKNMEWVEFYENCIESKQNTTPSSLLLTIIDWIDKTINQMTWNVEIVKNDDKTIITDHMNIHCSIKMYNFEKNLLVLRERLDFTHLRKRLF